MEDDNRPFPIQGEWDRRKKAKPCTIPWWLAEEVYKVYSSKFGTSQSLEGLAKRGGFGRGEVLWLLSLSGYKL